MFDLSGKRALVTGATGGIGESVARALHAQGASVAISGTRAEKLEALAADLKERVHVAPCNLSDLDAVDALPKTASEALNRSDSAMAPRISTSDPAQRPVIPTISNRNSSIVQVVWCFFFRPSRGATYRARVDARRQ